MDFEDILSKYSLKLGEELVKKEFGNKHTFKKLFEMYAYRHYSIDKIEYLKKDETSLTVMTDSLSLYGILLRLEVCVINKQSGHSIINVTDLHKKRNMIIKSLFNYNKYSSDIIMYFNSHSSYKIKSLYLIEDIMLIENFAYESIWQYIS